MSTGIHIDLSFVADISVAFVESNGLFLCTLPWQQGWIDVQFIIATGSRLIKKYVMAQISSPNRVSTGTLDIFSIFDVLITSERTSTHLSILPKLFAHLNTSVTYHLLLLWTSSKIRIIFVGCRDRHHLQENIQTNNLTAYPQIHKKSTECLAIYALMFW